MEEKYLNILKEKLGPVYDEIIDKEFQDESQQVLNACLEGIQRLNIGESESQKWYAASSVLYQDYWKRLEEILKQHFEGKLKDEADLIVFVRCLTLADILMQSFRICFPKVKYPDSPNPENQW